MPVVKFVWSGLFFVAIFASGFWLSRRGSPYGQVPLNVHKLIALAALVFLGITIVRIGRTAGLTPLQMAAVVASGVCFVALLATGGLAAALSTPPAAVRTVHHLAPYATLLLTGASLALIRAGA